MKHPNRTVLQEFGLPWMERALEEVKRTTGRDRPDKKLVIHEFIKEPPDDFPARYGEAYIREVYWWDIGHEIWHLLEEAHGWLGTNIPKWKQLDFFKEFPAVDRQYSVPESGTGQIKDKHTEKMNSSELRAAMSRVFTEYRQLRTAYRRRKAEEEAGAKEPVA